MTGPAPATGTISAGPMLSMFDPIFVGIDEFGRPVHIRVIYKNLLAAGEPGGGKSGLLNTFAAHAALSAGSRLVLFDGKIVELGYFKDVADEFVGADIDHAITTLLRLQKVMDNRYAWLHAHRRRKIEPADGINVIVIIFDEIALYSTLLGTEQQQRQFVALLRDLVARGRAAAMPVIAATQRPSVDIIPKSLRDLFGYRAAFRCTSHGSSDIILGDGWTSAGISATDISPVNPGEAFLIAEGGTPQRIKAPYLTDDDIKALADHAAQARRTGIPPPRRPGSCRRLTDHPEGKLPCHSPPTPPPAWPSSPACATWPATWPATPPSPSPPTAPRSTCPPAAPMTAAAPRLTTSPASSASPRPRPSATPGITRPPGPLVRSATGCSPSPTTPWPATAPRTPTPAASPPTPGPDA